MRTRYCTLGLNLLLASKELRGVASISQQDTAGTQSPMTRAATVVTLIVCSLCAWSHGAPAYSDNPALTIDLRWVKAYPAESRAKVETGLLWGLSFLGAELPRDADVLSWNGNIVTVRLDRAGLIPGTEQSWEQLLAAMKVSDEYRVTTGLDIGRFMALTLGSSHHYFALTGASSNYAAAIEQQRFDPRQIAIVESAVARGNRLIEVGLRGFFVAHEGTGVIADGTFQKSDTEVLDVMKNGQLRFALYDHDGKLKPATSAELAVAGKPAKCLWCHEIVLQPAFSARTQVDGYYAPADLDRMTESHMRRLDAYRGKLRSKIDFAKRQDHTYTELLYISFFEASAERIAREWNMPSERVEELLRGLPTHSHREFSFLGKRLYRREDIDARAPFKVIRSPSDPREPSEYEPNLLR